MSDAIETAPLRDGQIIQVHLGDGIVRLAEVYDVDAEGYSARIALLGQATIGDAE